MLRKLPWIICSLLVSCAAIERPDSDLCVINAPGQKRTCYNVKRDYDENGKLKPGVQPTFRHNASILDLNKMTCIDSADGPEEGWARMKAYIKTLREEYEALQKKCGL